MVKLSFFWKSVSISVKSSVIRSLNIYISIANGLNNSPIGKATTVISKSPAYRKMPFIQKDILHKMVCKIGLTEYLREIGK